LTAVFLFKATLLLAAEPAVVVVTFDLDFNNDGSKFLLPKD
jgi:hypothetical protein